MLVGGLQNFIFQKFNVVYDIGDNYLDCECKFDKRRE